MDIVRDKLEPIIKDMGINKPGDIYLIVLALRYKYCQPAVLDRPYKVKKKIIIKILTDLVEDLYKSQGE